MTTETLKDIVGKHVVYLAGNSANEHLFNYPPHGKRVAFIDHLNKDNGLFFSLLNRLDGLSYGNQELAMPKWVANDCGLLPSGFVGFALPASEIDDDIRAKLNVPNDYSGLVPLTEYCAIPSIESGTWIGHTCASLIRGQGLGLATKVTALSVYGVKKLIGVAQYDNSSVKLHSRIADLFIESVSTPTHDKPQTTFTYSHIFGGFKERRSNDSSDFFLFDFSDPACLAQAEAWKAAGEKLYIVAPGQVTVDGKLHITMVRR